MYVPLPPPDMHDSTYYEGKMKPDSVIRNLKPLTVYINDSIRYDSAFKPKMDFPVGFSFVKEISTSLTPAVYIDINSILRSKEVIIRSIQSSEIENILSTVRYRDNYGGIISFQNLLFSKDQKKAYFEVHYFKGKLNASTYVVYAEWRNGKWKYQLKQLSIS
ncbi:hypothetical protein [Galbibacter sp.]|jgi:hypothetical protein|uniref:hypothetical protein n=1 Tax=Galbibacter sp. TaxID=2918471 RepID=UPI003A8CFC28